MRTDGYGALTARSVAQAAGLKHQLVYYYFQTMDDLLLATFKRRTAQVLARYEQEVLAERPVQVDYYYRTRWGAHGEFVDLCAGTHVRYSSQVKAFKLLHIAGAYHRGDEKNKQLQRIYGTAYATKDELEQAMVRAEEAKKRDHR